MVISFSCYKVFMYSTIMYAKKVRFAISANNIHRAMCGNMSKNAINKMVKIIDAPMLMSAIFAVILKQINYTFQ